MRLCLLAALVPCRLRARSVSSAATAASPALAALERAPCLQCGAAKPQEPLVAEAKCAVSGLRLACSQVGAREPSATVACHTEAPLTTSLSSSSAAPIASRVSDGSCCCTSRASQRTPATAPATTRSGCSHKVRVVRPSARQWTATAHSCSPSRVAWRSSRRQTPECDVDPSQRGFMARIPAALHERRALAGGSSRSPAGLRRVLVRHDAEPLPAR